MPVSLQFEAYDNTEGQAEQAERNSHANDDGVIDASEKKAIKRAHTKALHSRHRGAMQFAPVRTSVWMKEGVAKRTKTLKNKITGHVEHQGPRPFPLIVIPAKAETDDGEQRRSRPRDGSDTG